MLSDIGAKFWNGGEWKMVAKDEAGRPLFTLRFSAEEHCGVRFNPASHSDLKSAGIPI